MQDRPSPSPSTAAAPRDSAALTLDRAVALHRAGKLAEAESLYRALKRASPEAPQLDYLLGAAAYQGGRAAEAVTLIGNALARAPQVAEYHNGLALALNRLGRCEEAVMALERALSLRPDYVEAHSNLGNALQALERFDAAEAAYRRAIELNPRYPEALNNLGALLRRRGAARAAVTELQQAVALRPGYAEAHANLAEAHADLDDTDAAIASYRTALQADPASLPTAIGFALLLLKTGDADGAAALFRRVIAVEPRSVESWLGLGHAAAVRGQSEAAREAYEKVLEFEPANPRALAALAENSGWKLDAARRSMLTALADSPALSLQERISVHFALARMLDRDGAAAEAFAQLEAFNRLRGQWIERRGKRFDARRHARFVDRCIAVFTPEMFARFAGLGSPSARPVFIVGMPRSGTTLCEQVLASHSQVHGAGERADLRRIAEQIAAEAAAAGTPLPYPECVPVAPRESLARMAEAHVERIAQLAPTAARFVDKQPTNFRHLGLIATLFPAARIIHCRRDPMDTCFSCFSQYFAEPIPWVSDLHDIADYYLQYERLMAHWQQVLPVPILEFRYEDLVADLPGNVARLLAFCGLDSEPQCLAFHETERQVATASHAQVRRPLYASSVGRWRRYAEQLRPLRERLVAGGVAVEA